MEKNKRIEEMAKVIEKALSHCCMCDDCNYKDVANLEECKSMRIAEELTQHYQPKLPENSVVLTKEGYDILLSISEKHDRLQEKLEQTSKKNEELKTQLGGYIADQEVWISAARGASKETAEKIINKLEQLQRCLKEVALNDLIISLRKEYNIDPKHAPEPATDAKPLIDVYFDVVSHDDKCQCPHCKEYFYKSDIGFKVEDTERYFYCPQCGGKVLLK